MNTFKKSLALFIGLIVIATSFTAFGTIMAQGAMVSEAGADTSKADRAASKVATTEGANASVTTIAANAEPKTAPSHTSVAVSQVTNNREQPQLAKMTITVGDTKLTATMVDNSSAKALMELLADKPVTIKMNDYGGFEKVGSLPQSLPRNDEQISTTGGDLILYNGIRFVIYYSTNSWNFTRLGRIDNAENIDLKNILGSGDVTVTLSLGENKTQ
jgi:hypothetical protein